MTPAPPAGTAAPDPAAPVSITMTSILPPVVRQFRAPTPLPVHDADAGRDPRAVEVATP